MLQLMFVAAIVNYVPFVTSYPPDTFRLAINGESHDWRKIIQGVKKNGTERALQGIHKSSTINITSIIHKTHKFILKHLF